MAEEIVDFGYMKTKYIGYMEELETKEKLLWWQKKGLMFTATGYGKKIPTSQMVKYEGRWHRIYCHIYSNVGSCYIVKNGEHLYIK